MAKTSKKKNKNKKKQNKLRQQRHSLYSKISRRKKKLKKLKRAGDITSHKKVGNQIMHIRREVSAINQKLGVPGATVAPKKVIPAASSSSSSSAPASKDVWITDPPYTKWQAMENFDKNIWSKKWKWFIIDGKKLSASDPLAVEFEASNLWSRTGSKDVFIISYNPKKKTIKYEVY